MTDRRRKGRTEKKRKGGRRSRSYRRKMPTSKTYRYTDRYTESSRDGNRDWNKKTEPMSKYDPIYSAW